MMVDKADISGIVTTVIGETFAVNRSCIGPGTRAADIDGWDSLAHTVLMVRLEKRLRMRISERIAAKADSVGELIDLLCAEAITGEEGPR